MSIANVALIQVLDFRDERVSMQREFQTENGLPLISFSMSIAGPVKRSALIDFVFNRTVVKLTEVLGQPEKSVLIRRPAGNAAILSYDRPAKELKELCMSLEDGSAAGRLLDLDVLDKNGEKLSRASERKCLICGGAAAPCARSKAHSLEELKAKTESILSEYAIQATGELAVQALLDEVHLTPKPGLVDTENSGAHKDMDLALMEKSAYSLADYFKKAAELGFSNGCGCSLTLQKAGIEAEKTMLHTTNGVNTHKGAIFSLGLLCAAAGAVLSGAEDTVCENAARIASGLNVFEEPSHGKEIMKLYKAAGARAEAVNGFTNVQSAADVLKHGGTPQEALLRLLCSVEDTNLLWRGGPDGLRFVQTCARSVLNAPSHCRDEMLRLLDKECIEKNLSPGGSADMLAAGIFLYSLSDECAEHALSRK